MARRDSHIIDDFREKARSYTSGETIFMLDGAAEFQEARLGGARSIDRIKGEVGTKVETFIWGNDNGSVMMTRGFDEIKRFGDTENGMLLPTLSEIQMMIDYRMRKPPVHIVVTGTGAFNDDEKELEDCFRKLAREKGVLIDVILAPGRDTPLEKMILRLKDEKALEGNGEEPLRLTCIAKADEMDAMMVDAINARLFYDSEEPLRAAALFLQGTDQKVSAMPRLKLKPLGKE